MTIIFLLINCVHGYQKGDVCMCSSAILINLKEDATYVPCLITCAVDVLARASQLM